MCADQTSWGWEGECFYRGDFRNIWSRSTFMITPLCLKENVSSYLRKHFLPWIAWHGYRGWVGRIKSLLQFRLVGFFTNPPLQTNKFEFLQLYPLEWRKVSDLSPLEPLLLEPLLSLQVDLFSHLTVRASAFSTSLLTFIRNCVIPFVQICLVEE